MVRSFYNQYYSANLMTATVYGSQPVSDLMNLADVTLTQIKNNNREIPDLAHPEVVSFDSSNLVSTDLNLGQIYRLHSSGQESDVDPGVLAASDPHPLQAESLTVCN